MNTLRRFAFFTAAAAMAASAIACRDVVVQPDTLCGTVRAASAEPLRHDPVLFVHGYARNADDFCPMIGRFRSDGWLDRELYAYTYSVVASHATDAEEIRAQVDAIMAATGARKVDLVAHSAGSVSSRYYLKNLAGDSKVDAWVSLAGPNHGTDTAINCSFTPCLELRTGSTFLATLNTGDETPGFPRYATWWSPCDEVVIPRESVLLAGATNRQTACLSHAQLLEDPVIYQQVRDWIAP